MTTYEILALVCFTTASGMIGGLVAVWIAMSYINEDEFEWPDGPVKDEGDY